RYADLRLLCPFPTRRSSDLNSLLHVPRAQFRAALERVAAALRPNGLFYLGVYGGHTREGVMEEDRYVPKRFFSSHTDEELVDARSEEHTSELQSRFDLVCRL